MKYLTSYFKTGGLVLLLLLASCSKPEQAEADPTEDTKTINIINPDYTYTADEFEALLVNLPEDMAQKIRQNPSEFLSDLERIWKYPADYFVIADKTHALGPDYKPKDLRKLTDFPHLTLSRNDLSLRQIVLDDLFEMVEDARLEGLTIMVSSTYRSYDYQKALFERYVGEIGYEQASRESAIAGTSQHQLGTVIDFGSITDAYANTAPGKWLMANSWKYGFSLSYPDGYEEVTGYRYENWHYRWITKEGCELQRKWFGDIQHYLINFLNDNREDLLAHYKKDVNPAE
ncbi:M15 family metallopeptidase [Spirochaeta cellobiosiphila]|uniref:M15 family metallopeptidase n=1 Tax=Spirochaeta cellobiosiphila TaxID=504483 RepID=UPI0003FD9470|nr:M15 family metallopeptidase [Spirochaeta cellobiosiphila]